MGISFRAAGDGKPKRTESQEQQMLFAWSALMANEIPELAELFHVPNGGHRNKPVAARLRREGVKAGIPDIFLLVPRNGYHGLAIEMKARGKKPTKAQDEWLARLGRRGYLAVTCHGFEDARDLILTYLQGTMSPWQTA